MFSYTLFTNKMDTSQLNNLISTAPNSSHTLFSLLSEKLTTIRAHMKLEMILDLTCKWLLDSSDDVTLGSATTILAPHSTRSLSKAMYGGPHQSLLDGIVIFKKSHPRAPRPMISSPTLCYFRTLPHRYTG